MGPSLAGSSEILMASSMAASRPFPPSPLRAGPKHSGRRMSRRTTTLAFSSTLSPVRSRYENVSDSYSQLRITNVIMTLRTINKDSKAEEVQISLSSTRVPADVGITLRKEHWTHLQPTARQVCHHLHRHTCEDTERDYKITKPTVPVYVFFFIDIFLFSRTISRSCSCRAKASSLLSMQEAAATSRGVDPRMPANVKKMSVILLYLKKICSKYTFHSILQ